MEISSRTKHSQIDSPSKKTNRTIKPEDRCVISYNFQQTHSSNYTHNLLIGMNNDHYLKNNKKNGGISLDVSKSKIASGTVNNSKVFKHQPQIIAKTYQTNLPNKMYCQVHSPRRSSRLSKENKNILENIQNGNKYQNRQSFSRDQGDLTLQEGSFITNPLRQEFNEQAERKKSPYYSKYYQLKQKQKRRKRQKSIERASEKQNQFMRQSQSQRTMKEDLAIRYAKGNSNYVSPRDNPYLKSQSKRIRTEHSNKKQMLSNHPLVKYSPLNIYSPSKQYKRKPFNTRSNNASKSSQYSKQSSKIVKKNVSKSRSNDNYSNKSSFYKPRSKLKKVTQNQLQINELSSKYERQSNYTQSKRKYLSPHSRASANISSRRQRTSKRDIQNEQMRQIQEKVRRSGQIKKNNIKNINKNNKEVLPFNADIDPLMNISKKSMLPTSNKTLLYKDPRKIAQRQPIQNINKQRNNKIYNQHHSVRQNRPYKQQSQSMQKQNTSIDKGIYHNKVMNNTGDNFRHKHQLSNLQSNTSPSQSNNNTTHAKGKYNSLTTQTLKPMPQISRPEYSKMSSFNIKKKDNSSKKSYKNEIQEDITENNKIKGVKVPEKVVPKVSPPSSKINYQGRQSKMTNQSKGKPQILSNPVASDHKLKKISQFNSTQPINSHNKVAGNLRISQQKGYNQPSKSIERQIKDTISQNSRQSIRRDSNMSNKSQDRINERSNSVRSSVHSEQSPYEKTARTVKRGNNKKKSIMSQQSQRKNSVEDRSQMKNKDQNTLVVASSPLRPTIPKLPHERDYKHKDWKNSERQSANRGSKLQKRSTESGRNIEQKSPSKDRYSKLSKRSQKQKIVDLDAQEEDRFGLAAQKNVTSSKFKKKGGKNNGLKRSDSVQKQSKYRSSEQEIKEEEEQTLQDEKKERVDSKNGGIVAMAHTEGQKGQGVEKIQQLIDQNGSLSSINDSYQEKKANQSTKKERMPSQHEKGQQMGGVIVAPIPLRNSSNLQELMKATQQVHPHQKQLEPILNEVEMQLQKQNSSKIEIYPQGTEHKIESENVMAVNLPLVPLNENREPSRQTPVQNETDYNEEQRDKIGDMCPPQQNTKSEDFFQCNLNQKSKVSFSLFNNTKYQNIDKDINNYTRAPITSFLYEIPNKSFQQNTKFQASTQLNQLVKKRSSCPEIDDQVIDQAISILNSIDTWIVERILEPFEDKSGKTGIWLYCHGNWILFLEENQGNFRRILKSAVQKALKRIDEPYLLEPVLKLISGVRIMRLKSSKKRIFSQLQYSLKKGHVLKVLTTKSSKWGNKLFEVVKVQNASEHQNLIQIKHDNDKLWIKQEKFKEVFEHFLLICSRQSHFWTHRLLNHKDNQKIVINLTSHVPAHGSITLFYPSNKPSSLLLYKQFDAGMLKYVGQIEQKANLNGNLYFQFKLHGTYSLFLQTPMSCLLAIESTSPLDIGTPQYIQSESLKNRQCQYVELKQDKQKLRETRLRQTRLRQTRLKDTRLRQTKLRQTSGSKGSRKEQSLQLIKQIFINMIVKK